MASSNKRLLATAISINLDCLILLLVLNTMHGRVSKGSVSEKPEICTLTA